jgi:hypothetical protein
MNGSLQLSEYPGGMVRLSCEKCGRSDQYRKRKIALCGYRLGLLNNAPTVINALNTNFGWFSRRLYRHPNHFATANALLPL